MPIPALRRVDDPAECRFIIGIEDQPQVGEHIFDLHAVIKRDAGRNLKRDLMSGKRPFEFPRQRVNAIADSKVSPPALTKLDGFANLGGDLVGLVQRVEAANALDRLPVGVVGQQDLGFPLRVVSDQFIGGLEDLFRAAEILFQPNHGRLGKVRLESQNVRDPGAAPPVDRLVGITRDAQVVVLFRQC